MASVRWMDLIPTSVAAAAGVPCPSVHDDPAPKRTRGGYRPWADLLRRTFAIDVLECPTCQGRMKLVAMVTEPKSIARFLTALGEPTDVPAHSPNLGNPH
jgi:hypothetical protein